MTRLFLRGSVGLLISCTVEAVASDGFIKFSNNGLIHPDTGVIYRAGIFRHNGDEVPRNSTNGAGAGFTAGLFLGSQPCCPIAFTTFRTMSFPEVFATTQDVQIPGVPPGESAFLLVRVWSTAAGSYDAARADVVNGWQWGQKAFSSKPLGTSEIDAPDIAPFTGFELTFRAATPVGLQNGDFEEEIVFPGSVTSGAPGWWRGTNDVRLMNPTGTGHFRSGSADGNVAFILASGTSTPIEMSASTYLLKLAPQYHYTLSYAVGNPASGTNSLGTFNLEGFPGYRVELRAGGVLLAADEKTMAHQIPEGEFHDATIEFSSGLSHPAMGKELEVVLINLNQSADGAARAAVAFDKVYLAHVPLLKLQLLENSRLEVTWRHAYPGFLLEGSHGLPAGPWQPISNGVWDGSVYSVVVDPTNDAAFFRLRR